MLNPLTEKTYQELCQKWATIINSPGESSIQIWYPIGGEHLRIRQFLADTSLQKKLLKSSQQRLLLINFQDRDTILPADFEEHVGLELHTVVNKPFFLNEWLDAHSEPFSLFVIGLDMSLKKGNHAIIPYLEKLAKLHKHLSLLIFTELDFTENSLFNSSNLSSPLFKNISYQSLFSTADSMQFYKYLQDKWQFTIPTHLQSQLIKIVGNHFLLLKETARIIYANPTATLETILNADSLKKKAIAIFEKLSPENQQTIMQLLTTNKAEKISEYLLKTNLVIDQKVNLPYWYTIKDSITSLTTPYQGNVELLFTSLERDLMELFQDTKGILTRERIATSLWQENWEERYSDWAIDQMIHRIREKLEKTAAPYEIVTKKGEGFYLQQKEV